MIGVGVGENIDDLKVAKPNGVERVVKVWCVNQHCTTLDVFSTLNIPLNECSLRTAKQTRTVECVSKKYHILTSSDPPSTTPPFSLLLSILFSPLLLGNNLHILRPSFSFPFLSSFLFFLL